LEKRTILAFVLSFAVFIIWSLLFAPTEEHVPVNDEPAGKESPGKTVGEVESALTRPVQTQGPGQTMNREAPDIEEKEIEVDTPLYRAVFSNSGPTIKSFKLKRYRQSVDEDSPLIELVNLEDNMGDFCLVSFSNPSASQHKKATYQVDDQTVTLGVDSLPQDLIFRSENPDGISVSQAFRFYPDQYRIDLHIEVINQAEEPVGGSFIATLRVLPPQEKASYYSYIGLILLVDEELEQVKIKKPFEEKLLEGQIDWVAYEDDFFISSVMPGQPSRGSFRGRLFPTGILEGDYVMPAVVLNPLERISSSFLFYFGPRDMGSLKATGKNLDLAVNFGWTDIIAKPLLWLLHFFNKYINNYGISIILITIVIKILFWPLTHKSYKSMKEMQKLQPRMTKLREKYKNDREQLNKEMMALYKTYKVNPMGGCLPMIIQLPVFFALFRILGNAIELRHAPFMLWINDLSAPDRLFDFPFQIPMMAPPSGIPVLTLLMGASMFIQQKMTPTPGDPMQAKIMMFLPVIFTFMFINFPSGLVLYWLVNNILSIGQQYRIHKSPA